MTTEIDGPGAGDAEAEDSSSSAGNGPSQYTAGLGQAKGPAEFLEHHRRKQSATQAGLTRKGSLRERLRGYTLAALEGTGLPASLRSRRPRHLPLWREPGASGLPERRDRELWPAPSRKHTIATSRRSCGNCEVDDAEAWVDEFLSREPAPDPFDSDEARPEAAEAAYATKIEAMWKRADTDRAGRTRRTTSRDAASIWRNGPTICATSKAPGKLAIPTMALSSPRR